MAETGKKADPRVSVSPSNDPLPSGPSTVNEAERDDVDESKNASVLVKTQWPNSSFAVEGVPTITMEGTKLTKAQLTQVEKLAPEYGVELDVEDVK
jgi:hypothetical protein